jgi:hypothetical protein
VLTWHNDNLLSGLNNNETILTPSNVNASNFGKLFSYAVDGYVYAEPLYKSNLVIAGGSHNVAFVATEGDSVYAFDTDSNTAGPGGNGLYWVAHFTNPAAGITTVPSSDTNTGDIVPQVGITGTPVIDGTTNTLYVIAKTKEIRSGVAHYVQTLHALSLTTGADVTTPYVIGDTTIGGPDGGYTDVTSIVVPGNAIGTDGTNLRFNALREHHRASITLVGATLYGSWASHGDNNPYHGWVVGFNKTTLLPVPGQVFNTSPNAPPGFPGTGQAGIWQSGAGVAADALGNLYFSTGNSFPQGAGAEWNPAIGDYPESVLRLDPTGGLHVGTYFTPYNYFNLDQGDTDLGSGGTMLLPDSAGSPLHPHLVVETGKQGRIYLLDRDMMGGHSPDQPTEQAAIVQELDTAITGVWGSPAYYNGRIYYHGSGDRLVSIPIANAHLDPAGIQRSSFTYGFPGSQPSISANNNTNGIVWELETDNYNNTSAHEVLRAFDANNLTTLLYASDQTGGRDQLSNSVKFVVPAVADGHVLVGSAGRFSVFGLFPVATMAPSAPTSLTATANSASQITLTWSPVALTGATAARQIDIERSTDGTTFTQIAVVARDAVSFIDTGLTSVTHYYYRIRAENNVGPGAYSSVADATTLLNASSVTVWNVLNTQVDLIWTLIPEADVGYTIERSADGGLSWTVVGTTGPGVTAFSDTGLDHQAYQYRVDAFASNGSSSVSAAVSADLRTGPSVVDHGSGFGIHDDLTANGSTKFVEPGYLQLTDGGFSEAGSGFTNTPLQIDTFHTTFTFRLHDGTDPRADGFTFIIQRNSPTALGPGGGGLAYGADNPAGLGGIPNSVAIKFDLFNNAGEGTNSTGIFTGGRSPTIRQPGLDPSFPDMSVNLSAAPYLDPEGNPIININDQALKQVDLDYDLTTKTLVEKITNLQVAGNPFVIITYTNVDIPGLVGNDIAFVGFGGGTGGLAVVQDVRTWTYTGSSTRPAAPTNLFADPYSNPGNVNLTWNEYSPTETGFQLERSTDGTNFTLIASLPFNVTTVTDVPPRPGTYFYRVRALGESAVSTYATSGPVAVLVPEAPSNLSAVPVSPAEADLQWLNNSFSATGFRIERSVGDPNHFVTLATVDAFTTSYQDTTAAAPNTYYYRVFATNSFGDSLPSNVAQVTLRFANQPVLYYRFDETGGTTALDSSGNGNTGTLVGGVTHVAGLPGFGNGLHFDGTGYVTAADSSSLDPLFNITVSAWLKADTWSNGNERILQKGNSDNQYRLLEEGGVLKWDLSGLGTVTAALPSTGVWHNVTGTYDGSTIKLYVDGALVASQAASGRLGVTGDALFIATKNAGAPFGDHFAGTIDEVRIYQRALSQAEIQLLPFADQDIGSVAAAGSAGVSGGVGNWTYSVAGSGDDIWNTADAFNFAYQPLHGDGVITARVTLVTATDYWAKAAVMFRQTLDAGSSFVDLVVTPTPSHSEDSFQWRQTPGGGPASIDEGPGSAPLPYWIRLTRHGNTFTAEKSADGVTWVLVGTQTIPMNTDIFVGLAVTAHNNSGVLNTSMFDHVSVVDGLVTLGDGGGSGGAPPAIRDPGTGSPSGAPPGLRSAGVTSPQAPADVSLSSILGGLNSAAGSGLNVTRAAGNSGLDTGGSPATSVGSRPVSTAPASLALTRSFGGGDTPATDGDGAGLDTRQDVDPDVLDQMFARDDLFELLRA